MTFLAIEFATAAEAIQWADASGRGKALTFRGRYFVADEREALRLETAGASFAYLGEHGGRVMTVPVN